MPLLTNDQNFQKTVKANLHDGEVLMHFFGAGRNVVALTNSRLLVSNFPVFGRPRLLLDVERADITGLDHVSAGPMAVDLVVDTASRGQARASLPLGYSEVTRWLDDLFAEIQQFNGAAGGAAYFEDGERAQARLPVEGGELRATDRNFYLLSSKTGEVERKIPFAEVVEFDFHRRRMGALTVFIGVHGGPPVVLRMKARAGVFSDIGRIGDHGEKGWAPAKMLEALRLAGAGQPSYLAAGERVLFGVRAGTGLAGAVMTDKTLRLTEQRLLLLGTRQDGGLEPLRALGRNEIQGAKLTRWHGEHAQSLYYAASLQTAHGALDVSVPDEDGEGEVFKEMLAALGYRFT